MWWIMSRRAKESMESIGSSDRPLTGTWERSWDAGRPSICLPLCSATTMTPVGDSTKSGPRLFRNTWEKHRRKRARWREREEETERDG